MNTRELIEALRLNADHLESVLQKPSEPVGLSCNLPDAIKTLREASGGYCAISLDVNIHADGDIRVQWKCYDGKVWTAEHAILADAINAILTAKSRPPVDPVKECDKALTAQIPF